MQIGRIPLDGNAVLAPMAGITDWPTRLIHRSHGAAMVFSEMISAEGITRAKGRKHVEILALLCGRPEERPFGIQIFGRDPKSMAEAAQMAAEMDADLIDINMGCPVSKIVRSGAGAALMKDPPLATEIISRVRKAINVPLTVKMRSGWDNDSQNAAQLAKMAESEGADCVTVHARTRAQGFSGSADWTIIAEVVNAVSIPVIGNGDVKSREDAATMMATTGCRAVMIGRAALGNPWIFRQIKDPFAKEPPLEERYQVMKKHCCYMIGAYGTKKAEIMMRKHLAWYVKGLPHAAEIRKKIFAATDHQSAMDHIKEYFDSLM